MQLSVNGDKCTVDGVPMTYSETVLNDTVLSASISLEQVLKDALGSLVGANATANLTALLGDLIGEERHAYNHRSN